ncbi:transposase [Rhodopirellula sp. SM50]|nr:IS200/IS605 family transposase [Rhodopirellula sp. SM50]PAY19560.1 transposase [Rhodopirellula sp. SM50]
MPQSHAQVWLHIVFSTKERRPFLRNDDFRTEMFRMLSHHVKTSKCTSASVGGYFDHVHLLVGLHRTITIAKLVEQVKTETSKWAKGHEKGSSIFAWQSGYGAFSVSHSLRGVVDDYIRNQFEHHAKMSFQDEYRRLCEKHNLDIDERYVWD